jgi:uncharacterized membrane protein
MVTEVSGDGADVVTQMAVDMPRCGPRSWLMPAAVVALAAVVRAIGLDDRPLWLDEALSVLYARLDLSTLVELRRHGTNPPLYHLLLSFWVGLFGSSEAALRSLSVIAGTGAVALIYLLGRSVGGPAVGLLSAGLLAVNSMAVGYSQEARYYALVELLAVAASLLLRSAARSGRGSRMAAYAAVMAVFVWTHTYAWFVLAAHTTAVVGALLTPKLASIERRRLALGFGIAVGAIVVCFLPWVGILMSQVRTVLEGYWISRPDASELLACAQGFVVPLQELRWVMVAAAVVGAAFVWHHQRRSPSRDLPDKPVEWLDWLLLGTWATLPVCIPFLWSLAGTPIFLVKYALVAQPAVLVLLAVLAVRRFSPGLLIVALLTAWHAPEVYRGLQFEDWRRAAAIIQTDHSAETPVYVCRDFTYYALAYYLDPEEYAVTPVVGPGDSLSDFARIYARPPLVYEDWPGRLRRERRAWLVLSRLSGAKRAEVEATLADLREWGSLQSWPIRGDVELYLFERAD